MNVTLGEASAATRLAHDLAAVRQALLEDARREAGQIVAEARRDADRTVRLTVAEVDTEVERERHRSELAAQAFANGVLATARNDARGDVLRKQEAVRRQLVDDVRAAALAIRHDPRYPILLDRLEERARAQLGAAAQIERDRQPDGGVTAAVGTRHVDYTLSAVADRSLEAMSEEAVQLWS